MFHARLQVYKCKANSETAEFNNPLLNFEENSKKSSNYINILMLILVHHSKTKFSLMERMLHRMLLKCAN